MESNVEAARWRTFGNGTFTRVSKAAARIAEMNVETYHEAVQDGAIAQSEPRRRTTGEPMLRSWRNAPDLYEGQASQPRIWLEATLLQRKGWRESVDGEHYVLRSPDGAFLVRYVPVGKTMVRTYFEQAVQ